jgi:KDO2-lipid IV(A) lauroyltransferase
MIKFFSRLPLRALYVFSSFLYLLAFYVVRHRHQVIRGQIEKVFPDSSDAERELIHKRFLKNFCDVVVEVLKSVSMTEADMRAHVQIANLDVARRYLDAGQSVMLVTSHLGNWEWLLHGVTLQ